MANGFYMRLAAGNLLRNKRMYGPYCVASALMSGMVSIILNLVFSRSISNLSYGGTVIAMFTMGIVVMVIFTMGYMLYINSFLIKRRKKEFGLYGVLGMERRHVARVILWENAIMSFGALLVGLLSGIVLGRLIFMLLMRTLHTAAGSLYQLSIESILVTAAIFLVIFILTTLYNLNQVRLANPVDLLKGEQKGEKRVRFAVPITIVGLCILGYAYYLAITVGNSVTALLGFWPAVILVIIATWLLFTGGSACILNLLKRNKRIYYKPRNFITISGLSHRMKQNAAGLANICILSTMVMVTVSCCCSLYLGQNEILMYQNPHDITMSLHVSDKASQDAAIDKTTAYAETLASEQAVEIEGILRYDARSQSALFADGKLYYRDTSGQLLYAMDVSQEAFIDVRIMTVDAYNAATGSNEVLGDDEIILLAEGEKATLTEVPYGTGTMRVQKAYTQTPYTRGKNSPEDGVLFIIVANEQIADDMEKTVNPLVSNYETYTFLKIDIEAEQEAGEAYSTAVLDFFGAEADAAARSSDQGSAYRTSNIFRNRMESYGMYGGLLFLGVFFAILFLTNTVLIIYFKQISEGFEDCERFAILQKVGLSDAEVKSTINRQMLIVFLMPLTVALIHIAAASNMIRQMLGSFMLVNFTLTMLCILVTCAVFVVVYLAVYRVTARTYYKLVKW